MSSSHNDHLFCGAGHILPRVTIGAIPDDILLEIFDFVLQGIKDYSDSYHYYRAKRWNRLVHVCKRWRYLVFASPLRLDLCLFCSGSTPVRETLDVWPPLLIEISTYHWDADIVAALEHSDRVRRVGLHKIPRNQLAKLMPEPFPALEHLSLATKIALVHNDFPLPSTFLGGSAPRLQSLSLWNISLPTLPQLLSSTYDLVDLSLQKIPYGGYISPEAMATCLCALTRLTNLDINFSHCCLGACRGPSSKTQGPSPLKRTVLASLAKFGFYGDTRYLEYLVAGIVAPVLKVVDISLVDFRISNSPTDIRNLIRFIDHSPTLTLFKRAEMILSFIHVTIKLLPTTKTHHDSFCLAIEYKLEEASLQLPIMAHICSHFSFLLSGIERLHIEGMLTPPVQADIDDAKWLEVFRPFAYVQSLQISRKAIPCIVLALEGLSVELATKVLPALGDLYLEEDLKCPPLASGSEQKGIERFITARQCSNHPVTVHYLEVSSQY
jgi:hypothetical protein